MGSIFVCVDVNVLKLDYGDGCRTLNILTVIELYILKGQSFWYINISIKLLKRLNSILLI